MSHESKFNNHMQNGLWVRALASHTGKPGGTGAAEALMGWGELPLQVPIQGAAEPTGSRLVRAHSCMQKTTHTGQGKTRNGYAGRVHRSHGPGEGPCPFCQSPRKFPYPVD